MIGEKVEACEHGNIPLICKECHPDKLPACNVCGESYCPENSLDENGAWDGSSHQNCSCPIEIEDDPRPKGCCRIRCIDFSQCDIDADEEFFLCSSCVKDDRIKELEAVLIACYMSLHVSQVHNLHEKDGVNQCWLEGQKIMGRLKGINK